MSQQQRTGRQERGSLALEQVLFIGAVVLLATGLMGFYTRLGNYFTSIQLPDAPAFGTSSTSQPGSN